MLSTKLKAAAGNSADATLYVDDVFSTYLYTGNGSTKTITNGIDLAGKGGMVWIKDRNSGAKGHHLVDTARGASKDLQSQSVNGQVSTTTVSAFNSNGFQVGVSNDVNDAAYNFASWTFRKAAKFFDVVTYTGTGSARTIAHSLGVAPGMIIVKRTDTTGDWQVYHQNLTSAAYAVNLNLQTAQTSTPTVWNSTAPTSSVFSVGTDATVNASGGTYVAYLYAHDTSSTGIIQCGVGQPPTGTGKFFANLGWEPQYIIFRRIDSASDWYVMDTMRGWTNNTSAFDSVIFANTADAEQNASYDFGEPTATGWQSRGLSGAAAATYIYMAIRSPNKPTTWGTQVYNPVLYSGIGTNNRPIAGTFPCDLFIDCNRTGALGPWFLDRLRSNAQLKSYDTAAENVNAAQIPSNTFNYDQTSILVSADEINTSGRTYVNYFLKRAPGFFDEVCYTATASTNRRILHNLTVPPELIINKQRSVLSGWPVYTASLGRNNYFYVSQSVATSVLTNIWGASNPTSTDFGIDETQFLTNGATQVAYLFATLAGISKVGSYTGNGTGQAIACGFSAGARFVLIKRTDAAGDWYTFDSARGLTSTSSPYLLLNSTAAEVTGNNGVYQSTGGFTLGATAVTTTNIATATYIFLAVA